MMTTVSENNKKTQPNDMSNSPVQEEVDVEVLLKKSGLELKKRSELHIARKIWHMSTVAMMAVLYNSLPRNWSVGLLLGALLLFVPLDLLRQRSARLNEFLIHAFRGIIRKNEVKRLAGTTYLLIGVGLIVLLFSRKVVTLALIFLAFADPIASFVGIRWGKDKIFGHKSVQGFIAAFVVCAVASYVYFGYHGILADRLFTVSLVLGLAGAFAELIPIAKIDDNFTIPVLSSIAIWLIMTMFGAF